MALVPTLDQVFLSAAPMLAPTSLRALSHVSPAVRSTLLPASDRVARTSKLIRDLKTLPFEYGFGLQPLGFESLQLLWKTLSPLQPLRRRELAGREAGLVPTEHDPWRFGSDADAQDVAHAAQLALERARTGGRPSLLLGAVLRAEGQTTGGAVQTASVGIEWIDGPAADPLQLSLRLCADVSGAFEIHLEIGSGAWSPWAEEWSLEDGSLDAKIAVAVPLEGCTALLFQDFRGQAAESRHVPELAEALAGSEGLRAAISIGSLRWCKEPPPWCPRELKRIVAWSSL